jgi:CDP-2,3-bis-(O-geranylgeranyl)-sn-glycerol synthase
LYLERTFGIGTLQSLGRTESTPNRVEESAGMFEIQPLLVVQVLALLTLANGVPVIATKLLGTTLAAPLDGGLVLADGQRLLGPSKTIRGVVLAILATTACAALLGLGPMIGLLVATTAMTGDLFSSFVKRRMKLDSGSMALGLDQVPESIFPAIASRWLLPITVADILCVTALFFVGELAVSRVLYKLRIRDRPY